LPFNARLAFALMSTVWIVPFLMFLLVTTNAAVADAAETNIATMPAMIAAFTVHPLLEIFLVTIVALASFNVKSRCRLTRFTCRAPYPERWVRGQHHMAGSVPV
jgi:hypothetical protein